MSKNDLFPAPVRTLTSDKQIRAYVNPTRMTILALLAQEKMTVSGTARRLEVHPANLTHHFKILERAGLIELVEKRETGRNLEKYYRALAYQFIVSAGEGPGSQKQLALCILRDNLNAALQELSDPDDGREVLGILKCVRLHPENVESFGERLMSLAEDFASHAADSGEVYSLNVSMYPTAAGEAPARGIVIRSDEPSSAK